MMSRSLSRVPTSSFGRGRLAEGARNPGDPGSREWTRLTRFHVKEMTPLERVGYSVIANRIQDRKRRERDRAILACIKNRYRDPGASDVAVMTEVRDIMVVHDTRVGDEEIKAEIAKLR